MTSSARRYNPTLFRNPMRPRTNHPPPRKEPNMVFKNVNGHIEVYDPDGNFLFSADTLAEARAELRKEAL